MGKRAFEQQDPCCDKKQLDGEINELMILLRRQNELLSGYLEKISLRLQAKKKKGSLDKTNPVIKVVKV